MYTVVFRRATIIHYTKSFQVIFSIVSNKYRDWNILNKWWLKNTCNGRSCHSNERRTYIKRNYVRCAVSRKHIFRLEYKNLCRWSKNLAISPKIVDWERRVLNRDDWKSIAKYFSRYNSVRKKNNFFYQIRTHSKEGWATQFMGQNYDFSISLIITHTIFTSRVLLIENRIFSI